MPPEDRQQFRYVVRLDEVVVVEEEVVVAGRASRTLVARSRCQRIALRPRILDARVGTVAFLHHAARIVRGAVIGYDDLHVRPVAPQDAIHARAHHLRTIVGRDDYGHSWRQVWLMHNIHEMPAPHLNHLLHNRLVLNCNRTHHNPFPFKWMRFYYVLKSQA